jgi:prepilin-type N-terminal cleavage/methylation domain-containing protein
MTNKKMSAGFTLSELLVSLAILGLISAFAVPKILNAVGDNSTRAIAKEAMATVAQAYDGVKADNNGVVSTAITANALTAKLNFVQSGQSDTATGTACTTASVCYYKLHNGAIMSAIGADSFAVGSGTQGSMTFGIDVDGAGAAPEISIIQGYDGRLAWAINNTAYTAATSVTINGTVYGIEAATVQQPANVTVANYAFLNL